jgi:hypothetical protein
MNLTAVGLVKTCPAWSHHGCNRPEQAELKYGDAFAGGNHCEEQA